MKRLPLFILLLLICSCVTSKRVRDYLAAEEKQPVAEAIVADWLEQHQAWYAQKAAKDFPAPATQPVEQVIAPAPSPLQPEAVPCPEEATPAVEVRRVYLPTPSPPAPDATHFEQTILEQEQAIRRNREALATAREALRKERAGHEATRGQLRQTAGERDYWEDKNEKKFWALLVMAACAVLYVVFKTLAARVGPTE